MIANQKYPKQEDNCDKNILRRIKIFFNCHRPGIKKLSNCNVIKRKEIGNWISMSRSSYDLWAVQEWPWWVDQVKVQDNTPRTEDDPGLVNIIQVQTKWTTHWCRHNVTHFTRIWCHKTWFNAISLACVYIYDDIAIIICNLIRIKE